jgi:hypothetical protein
MERNAIVEALRANHWNRRKAAQALKISYRALIYKIRDAGLIVRRPNTIDGRIIKRGKFRLRVVIFAESVDKLVGCSFRAGLSIDQLTCQSLEEFSALSSKGTGTSYVLGTGELLSLN